MFAVVASLLIVIDLKVLRDAHEVAAYELQLEGLAAQLPTAFVTGQKVAEELMADKRRALLEPTEKDKAEKGVSDAKAALCPDTQPRRSC